MQVKPRPNTETAARLIQLAVRQRTGSLSGAIAGVTLFETLTVVAITGLLLAIAVPSWMTFLDGARLNNAQDQVRLAIREAQLNAKIKKRVWQVSFREAAGVVQWATHPANTIPADWNNLDYSVRLDDETTLQTAAGVRRVQFGQVGNVNGQLGRITLSSKNGGKAKRCVVVSTLLGVVRSSTEQQTAQDGRFCY